MLRRKLWPTYVEHTTKSNHSWSQMETAHPTPRRTPTSCSTTCSPDSSSASSSSQDPQLLHTGKTCYLSWNSSTALVVIGIAGRTARPARPFWTLMRRHPTPFLSGLFVNLLHLHSRRNGIESIPLHPPALPSRPLGRRFRTTRGKIAVIRVEGETTRSSQKRRSRCKLMFEGLQGLG